MGGPKLPPLHTCPLKSSPDAAASREPRTGRGPGSPLAGEYTDVRVGKGPVISGDNQSALPYALADRVSPLARTLDSSLTLRSVSEVPLPDKKTIDLVRHSCSSLPEGSRRLAVCFYDNLFEMLPEVRDMFSADLGPQEQRMADTLLAVVRHLDKPDEVAQYLQRLGSQHHSQLGVLPKHYPYVGRALVRAVSEVSPTWSSSMSSAWVLVYQWITANMLAGAEPAGAPGTSGSAHGTRSGTSDSAPETPVAGHTRTSPQQTVESHHS